MSFRRSSTICSACLCLSVSVCLSVCLCVCLYSIAQMQFPVLSRSKLPINEIWRRTRLIGRAALRNRIHTYPIYYINGYIRRRQYIAGTIQAERQRDKLIMRESRDGRLCLATRCKCQSRTNTSSGSRKEDAAFFQKIRQQICSF